MQSLDELEGELNEQITQRVKEATGKIDSYWAWFRETCKSAWKAVERGENVKPGSVAPCVEKKVSGSGDLYYIRWRIWAGDRIRKQNKSFARDLGPANATDFTPYLKKACNWELTKALELEKELAPIRAEITAIREAVVRIRAGKRKTNKLTTQG